MTTNTNNEEKLFKVLDTFVKKINTPLVGIKESVNKIKRVLGLKPIAYESPTNSRNPRYQVVMDTIQEAVNLHLDIKCIQEALEKQSGVSSEENNGNGPGQAGSAPPDLPQKEVEIDIPPPPPTRLPPPQPPVQRQNHQQEQQQQPHHQQQQKQQQQQEVLQNQQKQIQLPREDPPANIFALIAASIPSDPMVMLQQNMSRRRRAKSPVISANEKNSSIAVFQANGSREFQPATSPREAEQNSDAAGPLQRSMSSEDEDTLGDAESEVSDESSILRHPSDAGEDKQGPAQKKIAIKDLLDQIDEEIEMEKKADVRPSIISKTISDHFTKPKPVEIQMQPLSISPPQQPPKLQQQQQIASPLSSEKTFIQAEQPPAMQIPRKPVPSVPTTNPQVLNTIATAASPTSPPSPPSPPPSPVRSPRMIIAQDFEPPIVAQPQSDEDEDDMGSDELKQKHIQKLSKFFGQRPSSQELKNKNILREPENDVPHKIQRFDTFGRWKKGKMTKSKPTKRSKKY